MKLVDYLAAQNLTMQAFGAQIGRSTATVSRIARGMQRPDWDTLEAIKIATKGRVTANDFHAATDSASSAA